MGDVLVDGVPGLSSSLKSPALEKLRHLPSGHSTSLAGGPVSAPACGANGPSAGIAEPVRAPAYADLVVTGRRPAGVTAWAGRSRRSGEAVADGHGGERGEPPMIALLVAPGLWLQFRVSLTVRAGLLQERLVNTIGTYSSCGR